jgi:biotin-(acetyl-CoA carboxylase) ligase
MENTLIVLFQIDIRAMNAISNSPDTTPNGFAVFTVTKWYNNLYAQEAYTNQTRKLGGIVAEKNHIHSRLSHAVRGTIRASRDRRRS